MRKCRFHINLEQYELRTAGNWNPLFVKATRPSSFGSPVNVGWLTPEKFDQLHWEQIYSNGFKATFVAKETVPEMMVGVDRFWDDKENVLKLPPYADQSIEMKIGYNLDQVGLIKLREHTRKTYLYVKCLGDGSYDTQALLWEVEV